MPKKSSATHRSAPRKTQAKQKTINLVLDPARTAKPANPPEPAESSTDTVASQPAVATLASPASAPAKSPSPSGQQTKGTARANATPPATKSSAGTSSSAHAPARPKANLISAENYRYVLADLRLIAILAIFLLCVIIALHFVLPQ